MVKHPALAGGLAAGETSAGVYAFGADLAADPDTTIDARFVGTDAAGFPAAAATTTESYTLTPPHPLPIGCYAKSPCRNTHTRTASHQCEYEYVS